MEGEHIQTRVHRGRMVVGFTTTCAISAYHYYSSWQGLLDTTLCNKVCQ